MLKSLKSRFCDTLRYGRIGTGTLKLARLVVDEACSLQICNRHVPNDELLNLAGSRRGKLRDEAEMVRNLVGRDLPTPVIAQPRIQRDIGDKVGVGRYAAAQLMPVRYESASLSDLLENASRTGSAITPTGWLPPQSTGP